MALFCPLPWWQDGRPSACVTTGCLRTLIPLVSCLVSIALLSLRICNTGRRRRRSHAFEQSRHPSFRDLRRTAEVPHYHTAIPRPVQLLEAAAVLADAAITVVLLVRHEDAGVTAAEPLVSAYLFLLLVARDPTHDLGARLAPHSAALYAVQWFCTLLLAPAVVSRGPRGLPRTAVLVRLGLFTVLVVIHVAASRAPTRKRRPAPCSDDEDAAAPAGAEETASLLSRLTFSWVNALLWKAFRAGPLEVADLYPLDPGKASAVVIGVFHRRTAPGASLLWRLLVFLRGEVLRQGAWAALSSVVVFVPPMLMRLILEYLGAPSSIGRSTAWLCVGGMLVSSLVAGVADCQCGWVGSNISARARTVLLGRLYEKVLRRRMVRSPGTSECETADGEGKSAHATDGAILNFVSGDVDMVHAMSGALYLVWVTFPVQMVVGTTLLYLTLGWSGVIGVALMVALLPLNVRVSERLAAVQGQVLAATDARIQASNELLRTVRTIKYYAWEAPFRERVLEKRRAELKTLRTRFVWWSISMTVFYSLPFIATLLTFFVYTVIFGNVLGTSVAFPALAMFAVLRIPLNRMADSITYLIQAHVSLVRIDQFLQERESEKYAQPPQTDSAAVGFHDAHLRWPASRSAAPVSETSALLTPDSASDADMPAGDVQLDGKFALRGLAIDFRRGALNVVCGPSGSGKSSLLLALLGEMQLDRGAVLLPRDDGYYGAVAADFWSAEHLEASAWRYEMTAYCPHEPWLVNQSIRANILLGLPFDARRYEEVLRSVALSPDLATFAGGDQAPAGENGSRLSGGQKQRVALARALYSPSQYVLLDDCLSAVDSRTANHVFFRAIRGSLMRGRTCILATHHTQLAVPHADFVVLLREGRVKAQGSAQDVMATGLLGFSTAADAASAPGAGDLPAPDVDAPKSVDEASAGGGQESKFEGAVPWSTVKGYLSAMGPMWFWILVLFGFVAQQVAALGTNLWIKEWAFHYDQLESEMPPPRATAASVSPWYYLAIYTAICVAYALLTFARDLITFSGSLKASREVFEQLLGAVLFAKLAFFDRPLGQITNRMSKDVNVLDQSLASFSVSALQIAVSVAMVVGLMVWVLPAPALVVAVLAATFAAYLVITAMYISGARDVKRIEAVSRSPLYQQVGEALAGCVSIRSYGREALFAARNGVLVDGINRPYLQLAASKQWLTMRIDALSSGITFATGAFLLWGAGSIDAGAAGLVLTYAATFTENMLWFMQIYAIIQENLTSLERIVEYTSEEQEAVDDVDTKPATARGAVGQRLEQRRHAHRPQQQIPHDWPRLGGVRFRAFSARYAPHLDPVLKGVSFEAAAGERVAVVGRTGAGKSSLVLALLGALEADADDGGCIEIDGINIAAVPLGRLRGAAVTVVPQDAELFDGSVRDNLDPLGVHEDADMVAVLRSMQVPDSGRPQPGQAGRDEAAALLLDLDRPAAELSRGQAQLLCVARGLLRRSRVLVLDEATASVDHAADAVIQAGLRAHVAATGATVLTIAHRLLTVANYDRVVVMDAGRVVEQGGVGELLRTGRDGVGVGKAGGVFRRLCEESGDLEAIERMAGVS